VDFSAISAIATFFVVGAFAGAALGFLVGRISLTTAGRRRH